MSRRIHNQGGLLLEQARLRQAASDIRGLRGGRGRSRAGRRRAHRV